MAETWELEDDVMPSDVEEIAHILSCNLSHHLALLTNTFVSLDIPEKFTPDRYLSIKVERHNTGAELGFLLL